MMVDQDDDPGVDLRVEDQAQDVSEAAPNEEQIKQIRMRARARQLVQPPLDPIPEANEPIVGAEVRAVPDGAQGEGGQGSVYFDEEMEELAGRLHSYFHTHDYASHLAN
eukprot:2383631-Rhodomonas_salina.2